MANAKKTETVARVLKWNDYSVPFETLPSETLFALAARGFTHILGNEIAAYETGLKAKKDEHGVATYSATEVAVMVHDRRNEKLAEMIAGTLGYRAAGPRMPKAERIADEVTRELIVSTYTERNRKGDLPKASDAKAWADIIAKVQAGPKAAWIKEETARRLNFAKDNAADVDELF